MEYIVIDMDKVKKYKVDFNDDVLFKFRDKVINECSDIKHEVLDTDIYPFSNYSMDRYKEGFEYRNIKSICTYKDSKTNNYMYKYECDMYRYPYLVNLIDRLMDHDKKAVEEIFHFEGLYNFYVNDIDKRINLLTEELNDEEIDIEDKINKSSEIKDLLLKKKEMLLSDKTKPYYLELQQLISFELIDEIEFSDFQRVQYFLDLDYKFNDNVYRYKK